MPSSGSTIQRSPLCRACRSPPRRASRPRAGRRAGASRISFSAATSASETRSVGLLLVSIRSVGLRTPRAAGRPPRGRSARRARSRRDVRDAVRPRPLRSICAASESSVASSSARPTSWTASGKPSGGEAGRHRGGRLAGVVEGRAVGHPARVAVERPQRAAALVGADRDRALGEHRRHAGRRRCSKTVAIARALAASSRAGALQRGVRDRAAEAAEALGAAREPLGVGQRGRLVGDAAEVAGGERDAGGAVRDLGAADVVAEARAAARTCRRARRAARRPATPRIGGVTVLEVAIRSLPGRRGRRRARAARRRRWRRGRARRRRRGG